MICNNCKDRISMSAMDFTHCEACGVEVSSGSTPGYKLCDDCSELIGACKQCRDEID